MPLGQQVHLQLEQVAKGDEAETRRKRMLLSIGDCHAASTILVEKGEVEEKQLGTLGKEQLPQDHVQLNHSHT